jgi:hypothetical protein
MPLTPNSSTVAYATPAEFIALKDFRIVGQLVRDDNTAATPTELLTDSRLALALLVASGEVEMACVEGGRYAPSDLIALATTASAGAAILQGIVTAIAYQWLRARRGVNEPALPEYTDALALLEKLRNGQAIFPFLEAEAAGLPKTVKLTQQDFLNQNLVSNNYRIFGLRQNRVAPFPYR